jgi:hypothetical protein
LRGGWPERIGDHVYHIYSRKHGDLERDYNAFFLSAEPYSQGNATFRDVNQNRRNDVWFDPAVGDFNVRLFLSLIQLDGYNPLVVRGTMFSVSAENHHALLSLTSMGRLFGFAYGHKENSAMFTHMATMYANALYQRGFAPEGQRVLQELYEHCQNFAVSRMYPYLTGSASWYILTVLQDMFGIRGAGGDLALQSNLAAGQFNDDNSAYVVTLFAGRRLRITFVNGARLDIGRYRVDSVSIDERAVSAQCNGSGVVVKRAEIASLSAENEHQIVVSLVADD